MDVFGGPGWKPPFESLEEHELNEYFEGKRDIRTDRHLTKLRKVFEPEEMTEDIVFGELDYEKLCSSGVPLRIGQAATQYGRHRDTNGVRLLLKSLSPRLLAEFRPKTKDYEPRMDPSSGILSWGAISKQNKNCKYVRSCIWALGEIMLEHGLNPEVQQALLRCAGHDNELIRLEAYAALTKLDCREIGPILLKRFRQMFEGDLTRLAPTSTDIHWYNDNNILVEAAVAGEWTDKSGTAQQKAIFVEILSDVILRLPVESRTHEYWSGPNTSPGRVLAWIVWSAAATREPRLVRPLQKYRTGFPEANRYNIDSLLRAEAACGSRDAIAPLVRRIVNDQSTITHRMETYAQDFHKSLQSSDHSLFVDNWRSKIRQMLESPGRDDKILAHVHDKVIRTALSENELDEWYVPCLLGQIAQPQDQDRDRIRVIWAKKNESMRLVAIQVLWTWKDAKTLLELRGQCDDGDVKAEIQHALDSLGKS